MFNDGVYNKMENESGFFQKVPHKRCAKLSMKNVEFSSLAVPFIPYTYSQKSVRCVVVKFPKYLSFRVKKAANYKITRSTSKKILLCDESQWKI